MKKPLSGKKWFYALGAGCKSRGLGLHSSYVVSGMIGHQVKPWASNAFLSGWAAQ